MNVARLALKDIAKQGLITLASGLLKGIVRIAGHQNERGFTAVEMVMVLLTVGILIFLIMPRSTHCGPKRPRVKCTSNLKQIALAFELWRQDNECKSYPMGVFESVGGSKQSVEDGSIVQTFVAISPQLRMSQVLSCPADKMVTPAQAFGRLTTRNISYFLAADVSETNANQVLAGDRDIAINGKQVISGMVQMTNALPMSWAGVIHGLNAGNVALTDGSAHMVSNKGLENLLPHNSGSVTNERLLIP